MTALFTPPFRFDQHRHPARRPSPGVLIAMLALLVMIAAGEAAAAAPEKLDPKGLRQELMQQAGPAEAMIASIGAELDAGITAAASRTGRLERDLVMKIAAELMPALLERAEQQRTTLTEPEHRLKFDLSLLEISVAVGYTSGTVQLINHWEGELRDALAVTTAEKLIQVKLPFPPEFDRWLQEATRSSDRQIADGAKAALDPFSRDPVGKPFPAFPPGMTTTDGKPLSLERFRGKPLLVDFWATWCGPCRSEVPALVKAYEQYHPHGFEIVGISFDKERKALDDYLKEQKMTWPQYFDGKGWENLVGPTYRVRSIPAMYLLDGEGKVVSTDLRHGKLETELQRLLPNAAGKNPGTSGGSGSQVPAGSGSGHGR